MSDAVERFPTDDLHELYREAPSGHRLSAADVLHISLQPGATAAAGARRRTGLLPESHFRVVITRRGSGELVSEGPAVRLRAVKLLRRMRHDASRLPESAFLALWADPRGWGARLSESDSDAWLSAQAWGGVRR